MFVQNFTITNIHCSSCLFVSRQALMALPGVTEVAINKADGVGLIRASLPLEGKAIFNALLAVGKDVVLHA